MEFTPKEIAKNFIFLYILGTPQNTQPPPPQQNLNYTTKHEILDSLTNIKKDNNFEIIHCLDFFHVPVLK